MERAERVQRLGLGDDAAALLGVLEAAADRALGLVETPLLAVRARQLVQRGRLEILAPQALSDLERLLGHVLLRFEVAHPPGEPAAHLERAEAPIRREDV